ncbi:MAG TPA: hemerythrin domain-containing protein [Oxalicibacterium sp.]|jgi:hemerythrin-like domain-containing protein|nr:hemerythrin domain-containing protein [Oxalicibacterium sp.]
MTASKTASKSAKPASKSASKSSHSSTPDAIELLMEDHKKVKKLFKEFEKLSKQEDIEGKVEIANQICEELTVHATIEEEIFYPAARDALGDEDIVNEAIVEHASAKDLIAQIQEMSGDDEMYDAKVTVLSEYINHHVEEEEKEMFPKAKKAKMDLEGLGVQLMERKEELMTETESA